MLRHQAHWTLYLEAGTNNKGQGYAKWYLGASSLHISSKGPYKNFNVAAGCQKNWFRKQLCSDMYSFLSSACQCHHA